MKIIFIGCAKSSFVLLNHCLKLNLNIIGICTKNKSWNNDFVDLNKKFKTKKIDTIYSNNINSLKTINWFKKKKPDLIFCFGWSEILKKKIISVPRYGVIGFHPTYLPENRGRHPIIWAIVLGLKFTASTYFKVINEKPDVGPIISQKKITISKNENSFSLYNKILKSAKNQIQDVVKAITNKKKFSNKKIKSNYWRKRTFEDGNIDWRMPAENINNLVRSLQKPYGYAHFVSKKKVIKIYKTKVLNNSEYNKKKYEPGKIIKFNKSFFDVKCGIGIIRVFKTSKKINFYKVRYL